MRPTVVLAAVLAQQALAVQPLVNLDYASYCGTALKNGVSQWLGIRYAAPPIGDLRFQAPQDPPKTNGAVEANRQGPVCLGTPSNGAVASPPTTNSQEDCLFLDVYAPSHATKKSKLPVYLFVTPSDIAHNV